MNRIEKLPCPKCEQETTIVIDPNSKTASVFSSIPAEVNRLYKLLENRSEASLELDSPYGLMITVPMNWVKIKPPLTRSYTEEQRQAMGQRLADARKAKEETSESNLS